MSKSLRLSEKWFRRGLWLVALVFANFLIGLGSTIVGDLPKMETHRTVSDFLSPTARQLETSIQDNETELRKLADALEQERLAWSRARADCPHSRAAPDADADPRAASGGDPAGDCRLAGTGEAADQYAAVGGY